MNFKWTNNLEIPSDLEIEKALIGSLLHLENKGLLNEIVNTKLGYYERNIIQSSSNLRLTTRLFYDSRLNKIYKTILKLIEENKQIDFYVVKHQLYADGILESIGEDFYEELNDYTMVLSDTILEYVDIVIKNFKYRILMELGGILMTRASKMEKEPDELMNDIEDILFKLKTSESDSTLFDLKDLALNYFQNLPKLRNKSRGEGRITTGFSSLDEKTGGFDAGQLIVIAGRPGMGKTSFALTMAYNMAKETGELIVFYAMEMRKEEIFLKLLSLASGVPHYNLKHAKINREDQMKLLKAADVLSKLKILINDSSLTTPTDILAQMKNVKFLLDENVKLGAIFVDYLQLLNMPSNMPREQQVSTASRTLKRIAKELKCPVIALSQINRQVENRSDNKPKLSDLRESGAIEQDADKVFFVYRPYVYTKSEEDFHKAYLLIEKQRDGTAPEEVEFYWKPEISAFFQLDNYHSAPSNYDDVEESGNEVKNELEDLDLY